ncbi:unnamed protein product (macronuclear) [Paramecium tetraurelia]|uniref:Uncharacterized protein n=1 Tax=Paramecium tetraurelia TaxID=5888 RepID=A0E8R8_PARTE|nr:uncharacterized protein GSPATT00024414001 [Paramecium tetraurelia]CAK91685.1 unnamed protein product [Paramecium tetraurelia]|eukprot:XP_001459082.1 hypothetical protein (macronuclear) [Paramecium tetraurelia strain d4-2]
MIFQFKFYIPPGFSFHKRSRKKLNPKKTKQKYKQSQRLKPLYEVKQLAKFKHQPRDANYSLYNESQQQPVQQNPVKSHHLCLIYSRNYCSQEQLLKNRISQH